MQQRRLPGTVLTGLYGLLRDVWAAMSLTALMTQGLIVAVLAGLSLLKRVFARGLALLRTVGALLGFAFGSAVTAVMSGIVTACTDILVAAPDRLDRGTTRGRFRQLGTTSGAPPRHPRGSQIAAGGPQGVT